MLVTKKELYYDYPDQIEREIEYEKSKRVYKREKTKVSYKLSIMGLSILGLILALFVLYGYANITNIRQKITSLEAHKIELEKEKEYLIVELESIKTSSRIEEDAMIKLGMVYPTKEQVVYVDVKDMNQLDDAKNEFSLAGYFKNVANLVLGLF